MADPNLGVCNIADLRERIERVSALIGCRSVAELGPDYLHFAHPAFRAAGPSTRARKLFESGRAVTEG